MGRLGRWGATTLLVLAVSSPGAGPVEAKARRTPPPPAPGWDLDRVRFEPLDGAPIGVEGVGDYRGSLELRRSGGGVAVVNELDLEDYLLGISEVPASWPAEAQKAQAIAARTYALHEIGRVAATAHRAAGADICATDSCQVYAGLAKERREGSGAWGAAVQATRGQVLLYRGEPILAKYSSSNGGQTVAGGKPYLKSVPDPDDARSPLHRWSTSAPASTVRTALGIGHDISGARRDGDSVVLMGGTEDDRVESVVPAADFRSRLNAVLPATEGLPSAIPSLRFDVGAGDGGATVVVKGRGWGHGIGLSQFGALGKALKGKRAAEILAFYYGGLKPVQAPDGQPDTIRVAVDLGRPQARVVAPGGRFRVLDGDGQVVVPVATGAWRVSGGRRSGVRVTPPADQAAPVTAEALVQAVSPGADGVPLTLRLSAPAVVRVTATPPGGAPTVVDYGPLDAGESVHLLPSPAGPGDYSVVVEVDGGPGRSLTAPAGFSVPVPGAHLVGASGSGGVAAAVGPGAGGAAPPATAAALLLALVAEWTRRTARDRPSGAARGRRRASEAAAPAPPA